MADVSKTVAIIFEGQDKTAGALGGVEKNLAGINAQAGAAEGQVGDLADEFDTLGKKGAGIDALVLGLKALGAGLVVDAFIDANVSAEKFEKTMVLLTGSNELAAESFDYVRGVSNKLGTELFATANAYAALAASTRGTALEGAATRDIFEAVSKAMSSLGKSSADTEGALLAISQIVSKGTVSLEELRGQLGERLPGAFQIAAQSMGLTTKELDKLVSSGNLTAEEFLPKFAAALDDAFEGARFDGYTNSLNRLKNSISEALIVVGESGAFDLLTKAIDGSAGGVQALSGGLKLLGAEFSAWAKLLTGGDVDTFNRDLRAIEAQFNLTADAIAGTANESAAETARLARQAEEAGRSLGTEVIKSAELSGEAWKKAADGINKSLKVLGIDPKIFEDPIKQINQAFNDLANNPVLKGDQFLAGLVGALRSLPENANLDELRQAVAFAFRDGKISADELAQSLALLDVKQRNLSPSFAPVTKAAADQADALKKNADAAKRAEEEAKKLSIELEKIASNERIKLIEANVQLNVAEVEAQTKRIEAAFESLDNTVNSTGDLLNQLFGQLAGDVDFRLAADLRDQIDLENRRRDEALKLQKELTEAQIAQIRAQTEALLKGDGIIKIDGAGLKPHLEAFMWEILRAVQVRVNQQGLALLLGA